jgi:hypothetical protein
MAKAKGLGLLQAAKALPAGRPATSWFAALLPGQQAEVRQVVQAKVNGEVPANWIVLAQLVKNAYAVQVQDMQIAQHLSDMAKGRR